MEKYWILVFIIAGTFTLLAVREAVYAIRQKTPDTERGLFWFNTVFLSVCAILTLFGGAYIANDKEALMQEIIPYPEGRYAPERGIFTSPKAWVFVVDVPFTDVVDFYKSIDGYTVTEDSSGRPNLLVEHDGMRIFITGKNEWGRAVLYYSHEGEITIVDGTTP